MNMETKLVNGVKLRKPFARVAGLALLVGMTWAATADNLIFEHFDQNVADNSPIGGAPGWHCYALNGGVVTDYTTATPNGNYPTLSHSTAGAGSGRR